MYEKWRKDFLLLPLCGLIKYFLGAEGYLPDSPEAENSNEDSMMTKTVIITLGAAAAYMFLVVGLMVWCRFRRRRRKQNYLAQETAEGTSALRKC